MKYLLELKEFDTEGKIDRIVKRIVSTGYISASMSRELEEVTGIKNIVTKLLQKVSQINQFYKNANSDFFDDVLLEFFDDSPYTYKVGTGIYLPDKTYLLGKFHGEIQTHTQIPDEYEMSSNKESFLLSFLLDFVKKLNVRVYKSTTEYQEERKGKKLWVQNPRGRDIEYVNYFKYFLDIQPCVYLKITHRRYQEYWEMDTDESINLEGWNSEQYSGNCKKDSVTERIKKRFSYFPNLGECVEVRTNGFIDSYTWYSYLEDGEVVRNSNRVLLNGYVTIKFKLKN